MSSKTTEAAPAPLAGRDSSDYRPDIEGLRAVAILLVVAAHAKIPWLEGGFIGVDVFFVLSGYLITRLLHEELVQTGTVQLKAFYARRLQRLLPALLWMVIGTSMAAAVLLAPFEQIGQTKAAIAAATWTSNLYFAFSSLDYFGASAAANLFLHTWSLGVEEQFYLLWPALMLGFYGVAANKGATPNPAQLRQGMIFTMAICLAISIILTYTAPPLGFYTVVSRGWQFALGAVTLLVLQRYNTGTYARLATAAGAVGLVLIIGSALLLDSDTPYPGGWALLPSLGTALVLWAGSIRRHNMVSSGLSLAPMQAIGRLSYSWYLWHWPVLILGATVVDTTQPLQVAALVATSLLLALLSYRLVEAPIRYSTTIRRRPVATIVTACFAMAAVALAGLQWGPLASRWAATPEQAPYVRVRGEAPVIYQMGCDEWYFSARVRSCVFGDKDASRTAILIGDSIAAQWFTPLARHYQRPGWKLVVLTKSACPMVDEPFFYDRIGRIYSECSIWRDAAITYANSLQPEVVILGSSPNYPFTDQQWLEGSTRVLSALSVSNARLLVLQATPIPPFDGPACLARQQWRTRFFEIADACRGVPTDSLDHRVSAALAAVVSRQSTATLINLNETICPAGECWAQRDGQLVFRDGRHLADGYAASLQDVLALTIGKSEDESARRSETTATREIR